MATDGTLPKEADPIQPGTELELDKKDANPDDQGGDPLDKIEDTEALRAEAKKFRAISQRHKKPETEEKPKEEPIKSEPTGDFLKKSDFELANQKKAIQLATKVSEGDTEETKKLKGDMLENWEQIRNLYTPRRGKSTAEEVLEDIKDAYAVFNTRRPEKKEEKGGAPELGVTKVKQGTAATPTSKPTKVEPKGFKMPVQPKDWYKPQV